MVKADENFGICMCDLFNFRPDQWGLSGDPFLWDEMI